MTHTTHHTPTVDELQAQAQEAELQLPYSPEIIAAIEAAGYLVELETGAIVGDPDYMALRRTMAELEEAAGGPLRVAWSCRPEDWDFEAGRPKVAAQ